MRESTAPGAVVSRAEAALSTGTTATAALHADSVVLA